MKRTIMLCCTAFILNGAFAGTVSIQKVRAMYAAAPGSSHICRELILLTETQTNIVLKGYKACATMIWAEHESNPFSKMSCFRQGKKLLEQLIAAEPGNIELRYLRLTIQTNIPFFLGYSDHIRNDKLFLEKSLPNLADKDLRNRVSSYLNILKNKS